MNYQSRHVLSKVQPDFIAMAEKKRLAWLDEKVLKGRVVNDPEDFNALRERRKEKINARKTHHSA